MPTSVFVCETGGMVVICAGTTGYNATLDLRYHWMRQKRLQGSHFANDEQAKGINDLVDRRARSIRASSSTFTFDEIPECHQLMHENQHPHGNMAVLVNARGPARAPRDRGRSICRPSSVSSCSSPAPPRPPRITAGVATTRPESSP